MIEKPPLKNMGRVHLLASFLVFGVPCLIFLLHTLFYQDYIVDDAGISYVYAKNLANGDGLVAQPGDAPVEGFSNFAWVILLVPFFLAGVFDPVIIPKLLSVFFVLASFFLIHRSLALFSHKTNLATFIVLSLLAMNSSFVIWTISGLEGSLLIFLLSLFLLIFMRMVVGISENVQAASCLGILVALIAMTRPDGLAYLFVLPLFLFFRWIFWKAGVRWHIFLGYFLSFLAVFGAFMVFRVIYFGDLVPNTYYAKAVGPATFLSFLPSMVKKVYDLLGSVLLGLGALSVLIILAITLALLIYNRFRQTHLAVLLLMLFSILIFFFLPKDWMGEFRFATPFFVFFYIFLYTICEELFSFLSIKKSWFGVSVTVVLVAMIPINGLFFLNRSVKFKNNPPLSFQTVRDLYGYGFNETARKLDLEKGSVLLPDVGGTLYYSDLRVYDLGGLTDKDIAKALGKDPRSLHKYIFETLKPDIIYVHGIFAYLARIDQDERLGRDYYPVYEKTDEFTKNNYGIEIKRGLYIRRELVEGKIDLITSDKTAE